MMNEKEFRIQVKIYTRILDTIAETEGKQYHVEFSELLQMLRDVYGFGCECVHKIRDLKAQVEVCRNEIAEMHSRLAEADETIGKQKKELERGLKNLDYSNKKHLKTKEMVQKLEQELIALRRSNQQDLPREENKQANTAREELIAERDELQFEVLQLKESQAAVQAERDEYRDELEATKSLLDDKRNELNVSQNDLQRESRRRGKAERQLMELTAESKAKDVQMKKMDMERMEMKENIDQLEHKLKLTDTVCHNLRIELGDAESALEKLKLEFGAQGGKLQATSEEREKLQVKLRSKEDEALKLKEEVTKLTKAREASVKKVDSLESHKQIVELRNETLKKEMGFLQKDYETLQHKQTQDERALAETVRERDVLANNILRYEQSLQELMSEYSFMEQAKFNITQQLKESETKMDRLKKSFAMLEKERNRLQYEKVVMAREVKELKDEITTLKLVIDDNKKNISELTVKLKKQMEMYMHATNEKYAYLKSYKEAKDKLAQQKEKVRILDHYIGQLKEGTRERDDHISKLKSANERFSTDIKALRTNLEHQVRSLAEARENGQSLQVEVRRHLATIADKEDEIELKVTEITRATKHRNVLASQLMRRNDELALLHEKLRLQQDTIANGECQYKQRVDDIRLLKLELWSMAREKGFLNRKVTLYGDMKQELIDVQQELVTEKTRIKAMEEEMQQPLNVHRWRMLQGSDPERYELLLKVRVLNENLLKKTQALEKKKMQLKEHERLAQELRNSLAMQPSPKIAEQLNLCKRQLQGQRGQLMSLIAQVNMYESYLASYQAEIERLKQVIRTMKKAEFSRRKRKGEASRSLSDVHA